MRAMKIDTLSNLKKCVTTTHSTSKEFDFENVHSVTLYSSIQIHIEKREHMD